MTVKPIVDSGQKDLDRATSHFATALNQAASAAQAVLNPRSEWKCVVEWRVISRF
jgi:hypothetical protein